MSSDNLDLESALEKCRQRIWQAATRVCRNPDDVDLLIVTKGQPPAKIRTLYDLGCRRFGENYAQELITKADELRDCEIEWHFIGQIQSNKIDRIVERASIIQSVADLRHASLIAKAADKASKTPFPIYIQVNCGEAQKGGVPLPTAIDFAASLKSIPGLRLLGVMAIPPAEFQDLACDSRLPDLYLELARLKPRIGEGKLSLGMSGDLEIAIASGSTCVRVGRAIVGERPPKLHPAAHT